MQLFTQAICNMATQFALEMSVISFRPEFLLPLGGDTATKMLHMSNVTSTVVAECCSNNSICLPEQIKV